MADVMTVPDIVLLSTLNKCINAVRLDYRTTIATAGKTEQDSMLYILFQTLALDRYVFFDNAKQLIITTPENPRHIFVQSSYDTNSSTPYPKVYINMPSKLSKNNSLGLGEGNQDEILVDSTDWRKRYTRRFNSTYNIVIVSDNKGEVLLLHHLLEALIIASWDHLELEGGLSNIIMGGNDLSYSAEIPDKTFARAITLNFDYETIATEFYINRIISGINVIIKLEDDESGD